MTLYRATADGNVAMSPTEEAGVIAEWAEYNSLLNKKTRLLERLTMKRESVEYGGALVNGSLIATDLTSQSKLTGALNFVGRNPARQIKWKAKDGAFVALTRVQIESIADTVGEFVAKCYDNEAAHAAAIDALLTVDAVDAYDMSTGWPI